MRMTPKLHTAWGERGFWYAIDGSKCGQNMDIEKESGKSHLRAIDLEISGVFFSKGLN